MRNFVKFVVVGVAFAFIPMLAVAEQIRLVHTITGMHSLISAFRLKTAGTRQP